MAIRVGLLTEGHDHLILCAYLAKLLDVSEEEIEPDPIIGSGHGHEFVAKTIDRALRRFYGKCAQFAVLSTDNDGNLDILAAGVQEDPRHPRHWLHAEARHHEECRWCLLHREAAQTRPALNWLPNKPGDRWPIVIAVPVESIEAWLLITRAVLGEGRGSLCAEGEQRSSLKQRFYRLPTPRKEDVEAIALPMIRRLTREHLGSLGSHSRSFSDFADQIARHEEEIRTAPPCW